MPIRTPAILPRSSNDILHWPPADAINPCRSYIDAIALIGRSGRGFGRRLGRPAHVGASRAVEERAALASCLVPTMHRTTPRTRVLA